MQKKRLMRSRRFLAVIVAPFRTRRRMHLDGNRLSLDRYKQCRRVGMQIPRLGPLVFVPATAAFEA